MRKIPGLISSSKFSKYGYEVWQLQGADPENPYVLPILFRRPAQMLATSTSSRAYWVDRSTIAWAGCQRSRQCLPVVLCA
jgi:hypothetical protein